jgi:serpin B
MFGKMGRARQLPALVLAVALAPHVAVAQPAEQPSVVAQAYNVSGQELFADFSRQPGNVVFSPFSIGSAMAMVLSGARGETQGEMAKVLRQTQNVAAIDGENKRLLTLLNGYDRSGQAPDCPADMRLNAGRCEMAKPANGCAFPAREEDKLCVTQPAAPAFAKLRIANALMLIQKNAPVAADYEQTIKQQYDAELFRGVGLPVINGWVKEKTEGKIEKILDKLDPNASHVLLNAVYFNALWASPFSKNATEDGDFSLTSTSKIKVPTMHQQAVYAIVAGDGYHAIALPYSVKSLTMVVVRPDEIDGVDTIGKRLRGAALAQLFTALHAQRPAPVALSMPRFKATSEIGAVESFRRLGMNKVFDAAQSDLSGLTGRPAADLQAWILEIVHRAFIDVSEEGTEAAAATAVVIGTRSAAASPLPEFHVDRPFLFYVVDHASGAILFQGRIADPRS